MKIAPATARLRRRMTRHGEAVPVIYQVTDRLHQEHKVTVPGEGIATAVSIWLAQLGAQSPIVDDLARAACAMDWPTVYSICDRLSVDVVVVDEI